MIHHFRAGWAGHEQRRPEQGNPGGGRRIWASEREDFTGTNHFFLITSGSIGRLPVVIDERAGVAVESLRVLADVADVVDPAGQLVEGAAFNCFEIAGGDFG